MGKSIAFVIEHLEPVISRWMLLEYRHASRIVGSHKLVFTNIARSEWRRMLEPLGMVMEGRVAEAYRGRRLLVLDPTADTLLSPQDYENVDAVVVGGIMGDHPPRHRTRSLLTSRLRNSSTRSLGGRQLSIDGAIYVAYMVMQGSELRNIPLVEDVEIRLPELQGVERSIRLPYAYPLVDGRPLITPGLEEYLRNMLPYEEALGLNKY